jgi:hypothetical protein
MNSTKIFLFVVLNCAPLLLSAGALPNPLTDLPDAIFNRPKFVGGGSGMHLSRLAIVGNIIYVADGRMGLSIYDASDPERPRRVGGYSTDADAFAVRVAGTHASVMTSAGTVVLDVSDLTNPKTVNLPSRAQDGIEVNNGGRLIDMKISHSGSYEADPETQRAIVAIVGDRAYISRDDGVIVIVMHGVGLPPLPLIARRIGADPISTEAWLPKQSPRRQPNVEVCAQSGPVASPVETAASVTNEDELVPAEQSWGFAPSSPQPSITGVFESGVFRLLVSGLPGQAVRVQRSSSLTGDWEDWQTITLGIAPIELPDEQSAGADQIFYRAVSP